MLLLGLRLPDPINKPGILQYMDQRAAAILTTFDTAITFAQVR
jgi:hypothetical protein